MNVLILMFAVLAVLPRPGGVSGKMMGRTLGGSGGSRYGGGRATPKPWDRSGYDRNNAYDYDEEGDDPANPGLPCTILKFLSMRP